MVGVGRVRALASDSAETANTFKRQGLPSDCLLRRPPRHRLHSAAGDLLHYHRDGDVLPGLLLLARSVRRWAWLLLAGVIFGTYAAFGMLELARCAQEEPLFNCLFDKVRFTLDAAP